MNRPMKSFVLTAVSSLMLAVPARAQIQQIESQCYSATGECACMQKYSYTPESGSVVYFLAARETRGFVRHDQTWQIQPMPSGARVWALTDADVVSIFNDCANSWSWASSLIPQDTGALGSNPPTGSWKVQWLSTESLRSLTGVSSVGVAATRIAVSTPDYQIFWISSSTIYLAYNPWLYNQSGGQDDYTWTRSFISTFDLSLTAALSHEFGHSLGFDDYRLAGAQRAVMYDNMADPNRKQRATDADDCEATAAARLYNDASVDAVIENFHVEAQPSGVAVSWHASQEYDLLGYLVERAPNRFGPFAPVGTVAPNTERNYSLLDTQNSSGVWRLRQLTVQGDTLMDAADTISVAPQAPPESMEPLYTEAAITEMRNDQIMAFPEDIQPIGPEWSHWICVCPDAWASAAQPLANFWSSRGYRTWVSTFSEVGGVANLRNYLNNARSYGFLQAVLLIGDANDYDYWSNNSLWINGWVRPAWPTQAQYNILPMGEYVVDTRPPAHVQSIGGWTPYWPSDWAYVDFNGDQVPDLDIGRAPVRSASDLTLFVQKVINVMNQPGGGIPINHIGVWTYARDKRYADGDIAAEVGNDILCRVPSGRIANVLWDDETTLLTQDEREAMARSAMEQGRGVIAINGTAASQANWSDWWVQHQFSWALRTNANWAVQPFLLGTACGIAAVDLTEDPWPAPYSTAPMIELALTDPTRGPWGCFGPTRAGQQRGHHALESAFFDALFVDNAATAGRAARLAVQRTIAAHPEYAELARSYILIGDPFVPVRTTITTPLGVTMTGPEELGLLQSGTYTAVRSGGDGLTYTYDWYRKSPGQTSWTWRGSGPSRVESMSFSDFSLRVEMHWNGQTVAADKCVVYAGSPLAITASMTGPTSVTCGSPGSWTASGTGGRCCQIYNYEWRISTNGGSTWGPVVGTSSTFSMTITANVVLKATLLRPGGGATASVTRSVAVSGSCPPSGGGGCPIVDAKGADGWNEENTILGRSLSGTPLVDYYRLKSQPILENGAYQLRIRENEVERTSLEQVRLLAVDHEPGLQAEASADGIVLGRFVNAARILGSEGTDLSAEIPGTGGGYFAQPGETLLVIPPDLPEGGTKDGAIFMAAPYEKYVESPGTGIVDKPGFDMDEYVLRASGVSYEAAAPGGAWRTLGRLYPREHPDASAIAAPGLTPVRMMFAGRHRVSSVGWILPTGDRPEVRELELLAAGHTRAGDVRASLASGARPVVSLQTADTLSLHFAAQPVAPGKVRDLFLVSRGFYTSNLSEVPRPPMAAGNLFFLHQNEPNPFSLTTRIRFELPRSTRVGLAIFDLQGRLVRQLLDGTMEAGSHAIEWDQRDRAGQMVRPGVYLYRMDIPGSRQTRRMVVLSTE